MTFRLGLTGSIGMGKSTTARIFADAGCAVWDADCAVHRLYSRGGAAVEKIAAHFPEAVVDGAVSRERLKAIIQHDQEALALIEKIVHPLVQRDREMFRAQSTRDITVFDIPLLFETGAEAGMDAVAVVMTDPETQRQRVLKRGTMTEKQFENILERQVPDAEKRRRADYVIVTDTPEHATEQVMTILEEISARTNDA